jgi:hypothetical protein
LVKASCKYVDYVAIVGSALGQGIVVLQKISTRQYLGIEKDTHLQCLFIVLDIIAVNVVMGANGLLQFRAND